MGKNIGRTCELCGAVTRPEVDHINGNHNDNSFGNHMVLCKDCQIQKTRMGNDEFLAYLNFVKTYPEIMGTIRNSSDEWMTQLKDAGQFQRPSDYKMSFYGVSSDDSHLYTRYTKEEITRLLDEFRSSGGFN